MSTFHWDFSLGIQISVDSAFKGKLHSSTSMGLFKYLLPVTALPSKYVLYPSVLVRVLQRNRTNKICVCVSFYLSNIQIYMFLYKNFNIYISFIPIELFIIYIITYNYMRDLLD
jgi:hypothetical protein